MLPIGQMLLLLLLWLLLLLGSPVSTLPLPVLGHQCLIFIRCERFGHKEAVTQVLHTPLGVGLEDVTAVPQLLCNLTTQEPTHTSCKQEEGHTQWAAAGEQQCGRGLYLRKAGLKAQRRANAREQQRV